MCLSVRCLFGDRISDFWQNWCFFIKPKHLKPGNRKPNNKKAKHLEKKTKCIYADDSKKKEGPLSPSQEEQCQLQTHIPCHIRILTRRNGAKKRERREENISLHIIHLTLWRHQKRSFFISTWVDKKVTSWSRKYWIEMEKGGTSYSCIPLIRLSSVWRDPINP